MTTWCFASRISWNTSIIPCKWERPGLIFQSSLQGGGIGGISLRCPFLVSTCCDNPRQASSNLLKTGGFSDFMLGKHFHELLACLEGVYNTWFLLDLYFTALGWWEFSGLILGGSFQKTMLTKSNFFFFKGAYICSIKRPRCYFHYRNGWTWVYTELNFAYQNNI